MFSIGTKQAYGIRDVDDEYNDLADIVALSTQSPIHTRVNMLLELSERKNVSLLEAAALAKAQAVKESERQENENSNEQLVSRSVKNWNEFNLKNERRAAQVILEIEELRRRQQLETDFLDKLFISEAEAQELEKQRKQMELEQLEHRKKLEEKRVAEEKLQKELQEKQKQEQEARVAQQKLEEEKKAQVVVRTHPSVPPESKKDQSLVPAEFRGCVVYRDLLRYSSLQDNLNEIAEKTKHITKSSKFYHGAIKVVNAPLNQISPDTSSKISHFTDLFHGKRVHVPGLATGFSSTQEKNGDLFVKNLFAFRFVKKADAESSENKLKLENLKYVADIGVALAITFPEVEQLIQAHFYKVCPFLVPFSYPRNGMDIIAYAAALGHEINIGDSKNKSVEASTAQSLLDKLSGYCMLYAFMVESMTSHPAKGKKPTTFFCPKEVWGILAKIMYLDPQEEVTATILYTLLEILHDLLAYFYRYQYKKLLIWMKRVYVERIRKVQGKSASLARLELLLNKLLH